MAGFYQIMVWLQGWSIVATRYYIRACSRDSIFSNLIECKRILRLYEAYATRSSTPPLSSPTPVSPIL